MQRLSPGTVIVGIFAVLFGLVGAYAVRQSLQKPPQAAAEEPAPRPTLVPVASADLEPGRPITLGDVAIMELTAEQLAAQSGQWPAQYMTNPQQIIGRTLNEIVVRGMPFTTTDFYPEGMGPTVQDRLKPGLRAVTIPIAGNSPDVGMTSPGAFVDILFRAHPDGDHNFPETTITLIESVEVLAVGDNLLPGRSPETPPNNVTLAVSPEQAGALKVVQGRGELMLALRSPDDLEKVGSFEPQTLESLLGVIVEPTPPAITTDVFRGSNKATNSFTESVAAVSRITGRPLSPRSANTNAPTVILPGVSDTPASVDEPKPIDSAAAPVTQPTAISQPEPNAIVSSAERLQPLSEIPAASVSGSTSSVPAGGQDLQAAQLNTVTRTTKSYDDVAPRPRREVRAQWSIMNSLYIDPPQRRVAAAVINSEPAVGNEARSRPGVQTTPVPAASQPAPEAGPVAPAKAADALPPSSMSAKPIIGRSSASRTASGRAETTLYRGVQAERRVFEGQQLVAVINEVPAKGAHELPDSRKKPEANTSGSQDGAPTEFFEVVRGGQYSRQSASN